MVVRPYTAQAEGEINLYKNDRVKGEAGHNLSLLLGFVYLCFCVVKCFSFPRDYSLSNQNKVKYEFQINVSNYFIDLFICKDWTGFNYFWWCRGQHDSSVGRP